MNNFKKNLQTVDESCSTQLDLLANEEVPGPHAMPDFIAIFT